MQRLGLLSFQSNDRTDVFAVQEVWENGSEGVVEDFLNIEEPFLETEKPWITGKVPTIKPVEVDGDTAIVQAIFKGENYSQEFYMTLYVECEMAEEVYDDSERVREEQEKKERQVEVYM